jgi:light-regulated signal transduction histidine kinase (bacteriophytochrome)
MNKVLNVLCLEDSPRDAEIMRELLIDAGYELKMDCTAVEKEFVSFLRSHRYDIILSDFKLPGFDGFTALRWSVEICPDVPFICISGTVGEETAVELLKKGAVDYILKDRLVRLPSAIQRALDEAKEKEAHRLAVEEIQKLNAELEQRVIERTVQLKAANKELEAFTYSVSHDLRAPLRAVDGFSRFVLEDYENKLDSEGRRLLNLIRSNIQKMDQLITDLLALSRVTRCELNLSGIDMTQMAISMFNESAAPDVNNKISLTVDPLPEACADPTYIRQVWANLIANAIKFSSKEKKPSIRICGRIENGFNVYCVKDNGVGFNPEYAHKLFGVFQRLHKSDDFEGTGVGLAIVQRIVHRHGGKVWAESEEGKGATFYFSLPVKKRG